MKDSGENFSAIFFIYCGYVNKTLNQIIHYYKIYTIFVLYKMLYTI